MSIPAVEMEQETAERVPRIFRFEAVLVSETLRMWVQQALEAALCDSAMRGICQHMSAYVSICHSIRQHTSAYVSIRQHMLSACGCSKRSRQRLCDSAGPTRA